MLYRTPRIRFNVQKLKALLSSLRVSTRIWYDLLVPVTMLLLLTDHEASSVRYALTVAAVVAFHAGHTFFNDISDIEVDRQSIEPSRNQRALVIGTLSKPEMAVVGGLLTVLSIIFVVVVLPWRSAIIITVIASALALTYNFEPVHLSARPLVKQLFWPVMWVLMFYVCASASPAGNWRKALPYLVFVVLFMGLGDSLTKDIRDVDNDAKGGRRTTVVKYGVPRTAGFAWGFHALSLLAWGWLMLTYPLPPLELSFRDYLLAEADFRDSLPYSRSFDYWARAHRPTLPPAPQLPLAKHPSSLIRPRFVRRSAHFSKETWQRLKTRATQVGLTPTGVLIAAYAEILALWSKSQRLPLNVTHLNRLSLHPQVKDLVGQFASFTLLTVDNSGVDSFEVRARRLQAQLWEDFDHRHIGGVRVRVVYRAGAKASASNGHRCHLGQLHSDCEPVGERVWLPSTDGRVLSSFECGWIG
ncbi:UbiA family prenyltransferase [Candidatus Poribacteria bacterium]|nr:UbiA family prenyltransferase [Candidatus Poribacteria bacterium]